MSDVKIHPSRSGWLAWAIACLLLSLAASRPASALDEGYDGLERHQDGRAAQSVREYWTPERMANARPLPLPIASASATPPAERGEGEDLEGLSEPVAAQDGAPPTLRLAPDWNNVVLGTEIAGDPEDQGAPSPDPRTGQNAGTLGAHFTSSRLIPLRADVFYPYRTVGKLFFTQPGVGDFVCSAAVIRPRIVLTAGHCVHSGTATPGFFTNFRFIPAYRDGAAPYGVWDWAYVVVPRAWSRGGGSFPNAADYAMFEMQDNRINGAPRRIGEVTGYLGWQTRSLGDNHVHMLGYPGNLDNGRKMHQITAGSFRNVSPNAVEYGSDMRGGSSGGPWIQNFGRPAAGQTGGRNRGLNRVVGITSFGFTSTGPKVQGSSIPDSRFVSVLNATCAHRAGNCP